MSKFFKSLGIRPSYTGGVYVYVRGGVCVFVCMDLYNLGLNYVSISPLELPSVCFFLSLCIMNGFLFLFV